MGLERMSTTLNPVSQIPQLGIAWNLTITGPPDKDGNSTQVIAESQEWQPETMRIVFECNLVGFIQGQGPYWTAKIDIYNLSADQAASLVYWGQGSTMSLSAGYQAGPYGVIYQGVIYQVLYERPEVVDNKITLQCYTGMKETIGNIAYFRGDVQSSQAALIAKMCSTANTPITIDPASQGTIASLSSTTLPRARPFFGNPVKAISEIASGNNLQAWYGFNGMAIDVMSPSGALPTITYTPTTGILGTPQQTQYGVSLVVTLDPRLRVQPANPMIVNISDSIIRQLQVEAPGARPLLAANGNYIVNGLQHRGDSRGNQWETEITGITSQGGIAEYAYQIGAQGAPSSSAPYLDRRAPLGGDGK
jgi:hypothetical protein